MSTTYFRCFYRNDRLVLGAPVARAAILADQSGGIYASASLRRNEFGDRSLSLRAWVQTCSAQSGSLIGSASLPGGDVNYEPGAVVPALRGFLAAVNGASAHSYGS